LNTVSFGHSLEVTIAAIKGVRALSNDSSAASPVASTDATSRRRLLAFLGAGGAAVLASLFSRDEAQAGHDTTNVMHLGEVNNAPGGRTTSLNANAPGGALSVNNVNGEGGAIGGHGGEAGTGVTGVSVIGDGVQAFSESGAGIRAHCDTGPGGVFTSNSDDPDVPALRAIGEGSGGGLRGETSTGVGVQGFSEAGTAVKAISNAATGIAIEAISAEGEALRVQGVAGFSTAGSGVIPAGSDSAFVSNPTITPISHVPVTLTSDPRPRELRWVEPSPASGFTVHLSGQAPRAISFTYLIVEPANP
jgi:hypothetical protein